MSVYAVQQALFDHLRSLEAPGMTHGPGEVATEGYQLTEPEVRALREGDVAQFHRWGVHPVLINSYCRANGWKRADYRVLFPAGSDVPSGGVRWRS